MNQLRKLMKREDGATQMIEAAIIYPVVFMCVFLLLYIGLYILQTITVSTYAQKAALLTAREISYPGYLAMVDDNGSAYSDASVEGSAGFLNSLKLNNDPEKGNGQTYRYWSSDMMKSETRKKYENIVKEMVINHSIITSKEEDDIDIEIETKNLFIVQYVNVTVTQKLMGFPVLEYFGMKTPVVTATAQTAVSDTDEIVRNVDFVTDTLAAFANSLGLDIAGMKEKINSVKGLLGLD